MLKKGLFIFTFFFCLFLSGISIAKQEQMSLKDYQEMVSRFVQHPSDIVPYFPKTVHAVGHFVQLSKQLAHQRLEEIFSIKPSDRTLENTFFAQDELLEMLNRTSIVLGCLEEISPDQAIRDECTKKRVDLNTSLFDVEFKNPKWFDILNKWENQLDLGSMIDKQKILDLISTKKKDFYISEADSIEIKKIDKKIEEMKINFNNNVDDGTWREENPQLLNALVKAENEIAKKLKYKNYAEYSLRNSMAKTPENVELFLNDLIKRLKEKGKYTIFNKKMLQHAYQNDPLFLSPNDLGIIAEYFPVKKTVRKIFDVFEVFFDITIKKVPVEGLWHDDVECVQVIDNKERETLGYIFLDLYAREGKDKVSFSSGFCDSILRGQKNGALKTLSAQLIVTHFFKPEKGCPSLMMFKQITTFFHELGHAMHGIFGRTQFACQSGMEVKPDFLEVPSEFFELWAYDKEIIDKISGHYQTGKLLPDDLYQKIVYWRDFFYGFDTFKFALKSLFFLKLYGPEGRDSFELSNKIYGMYSSNIFSRKIYYGVMNYSYLWSEAYAHDLFSEIKKQKHGLLNPEIGRKFREKVLSKGGSVDPNELLKDFLGREPNSDAFFKDLGLI